MDILEDTTAIENNVRFIGEHLVAALELQLPLPLALIPDRAGELGVELDFLP